MKDLSKLIVCVVGCELVGIAGTPFTISAIPNWYSTLNKPFFTPPSWVFGPAWTLLYFLMGVAIYIVWKSNAKKQIKKSAIKLFLIQLGLNFIWSPIFFGLRSPEIALVVIAMLWVAIINTMMKFIKISKLACYLLVPYILWVSFATTLNLAIVLLN